MAMKGSPTIIEPTTSSNSPLPSIPSLSPNPSSSSESFDSSRPNSQGSSATSRSVSPSPIPKNVLAIDSQESIELPALPSNPPLPKNTSASQIHCQDDPPRSVPPAPAASPRNNQRASWFSRFGSLIPRRNWFANALGTVGLGLTVIGMIVFGERTYKLAVWSAWNDALDTCGQLNSTGISLGSNCRKLLSNNTADVTLPPYSHWKRTLDAASQAGSRLLKDSFTKRSTLLNDRPGNDTVNSSFFNFSPTAIFLSCTIIMGGLSFIFFHRYSRTEEVFTSPVRSDWQFTRHHQQGPETVRGEGYRIIKRNPEDSHPLGQLRQRIRSSQPNAVENPTGEPTWQSHDTSEDTLVGPWKDTRWGTSTVSLSNDTSDEKHENLIELETEGPNKTFFDPETGEFIHLTPWKSTGGDEIHGLKPDGKGSTKRALAQMALGGTGWAGGKNIDDQLAEELQANGKGEEKESEPHQAGDCITGQMANEVPSGKPTMDPIVAVNEKDTDNVDPKVTEFLLRKPWYAGTKNDTEADADGEDEDGDPNVELAEPKIISVSSTKSDKEQEDEGFWIPQTPPDGRQFSFNTATGLSKMPRTLRWSEPMSNSTKWETEAMDSSQLPYADREDTRVDSRSLQELDWQDRQDGRWRPVFADTAGTDIDVRHNSRGNERLHPGFGYESDATFLDSPTSESLVDSRTQILDHLEKGGVLAPIGTASHSTAASMTGMGIKRPSNLNLKPNLDKSLPRLPEDEIIDENAKADTNYEGAGAARYLHSASTSPKRTASKWHAREATDTLDSATADLANFLRSGPSEFDGLRGAQGPSAPILPATTFNNSDSPALSANAGSSISRNASSDSNAPQLTSIKSRILGPLFVSQNEYIRKSYRRTQSKYAKHMKLTSKQQRTMKQNMDRLII